MEWFSGTVDEALSEYQKNIGILIVYICDETNPDGNTLNFNKLWDTFEKSILDGVFHISIRLDKNSKGAAQFSEFFPTPVFPVCYVIGLNGQPLEVITTVEELTVERLNNSFSKSVNLYKSQLTEQKISLPTAETNNEGKNPKSEDVKGQETSQQKDEEPNASLDDKVNYARKLLEEKRKKDEEKAKSEAKEKELLRRNEGKLLGELREKNKEKELKEMAEARRKEKIEDQAALKRLRDQIQRDKEERANRAKGIQNDTPKEEQKNANTPAPNPIKCDECRIQCKFPDGSSLVKTFAPTAPLQAIVDVVNEDPRKPPAFLLFQSYPRRLLEDSNKTLEELSLTPSASLLVVPAVSNLSQKNDALLPYSYLELLFGLIYAPFTYIYSFFTNLFAKEPPKNTSIGTNKEQLPKRIVDNDMIAQTRLQRDGNVNRLKTGDESDDDNATWNGNSTQQL